MFTMSLLGCIIVSSVFTVTYQAIPVTTKVSDTPSIQPCMETVELRISKLNTKIEQQDKAIYIALQNIKIEEQKMKTNKEIVEFKSQISQQNTRIAELNTRIEQQNTKFADQNTKFADQNTKFAEQENNIVEQNYKMKEMEMKIEELEKEVDQANNLETGSIFTRWGRRDCPRNVSQLVYSGITGGSRFDHSGGAAEYVCLPPDPSWNQNKHYNGSYWGLMYGAAYQDIPKAILNNQVPCAVCRTSQLSTVVMIPARSECYPGWQEAYHGQLVSNQYDHKAASQHVCLDDDPQTNGTYSSYYGKLMYSVKAKCGLLPCPPYEQHTLLTCVVCLK